MEEVEVPILDMKVEEGDESDTLCDVAFDMASDNAESDENDTELSNDDFVERLTEIPTDHIDEQPVFKHPRKKVTERNFICSCCGKRFLHLGHYKRHMKLHEPLPVTILAKASKKVNPLCDRSNASTALKCNSVQPDKSHGIQTSPSKVMHVPVAFPPDFSLTDHKKTIQRSFKCQICGKGFGRNSHLKRHLKLHPDKEESIQRSFKCEICGKGFGRNSHLKRHVKLHSSKEDFVPDESILKHSSEDDSVADESFLMHSSEKDSVADENPLMPTESLIVQAGLVSSSDDIGVSPGLLSFQNEFFESVRPEGVTSAASINTYKVKTESLSDMPLHSPVNVKTGLMTIDSSDDMDTESTTTHFPDTANIVTTIDNSPAAVHDLSIFSVGRSTKISLKEVVPPTSVSEAKLPIQETKNSNSINSDKLLHLRENIMEDIHADKTLTENSVSEAFDLNYRSKRELECHHCGKKFGRKCHLNRHVKTHNVLEYHNCEICGKRFGQNAYLKAHMNTVHAPVKAELEKIFGCPVCKKEFGRMSHLKRHMKLHLGGKNYVCSVCGKSFLQNSNLKNHIKSQHAEHDNEGFINKRLNKKTKEEYYECDICSRNFALISGLKAHINTYHVGPKILEKCFDCTFCGKQFGRNSHLKRHVKLHVGGKLFMCDLCGKGFKQNSNLKNHIRMVHLRERTHKCNFCEKMFLQRSNLNTHLRTHTGEKPYECSICGRSFIQGNQLKYHMQSHMGIAPFTCTLCRRSFTNNRSFKKHKNIHETRKNFYCDHCPLRFCYRNELKFHLLKMHAEQSSCLKDKNPRCTRASESIRAGDAMLQATGEMVVVKEEVEEIIKEEPEDYASDYEFTNESFILSSNLSADDIICEAVDPLDENQLGSSENMIKTVSENIGNMSQAEVDEEQSGSQERVIQSVNEIVRSMTWGPVDENLSTNERSIPSVNETVRNITLCEADEEEFNSQEKGIQSLNKAPKNISHVEEDNNQDQLRKNRSLIDT